MLQPLEHCCHVQLGVAAASLRTCAEFGLIHIMIRKVLLNLINTFHEINTFGQPNYCCNQTLTLFRSPDEQLLSSTYKSRIRSDNAME